MNFQVEWLSEAVSEVLNAWEAAGGLESEVIRAATEKLDQQLATDPMAIGESRANDFVRAAFVGNVRIGYRVDRLLHQVVVFAAYVRR